MNRKYSWRPDLPDHRDYPYIRKVAVLPSKTDLRNLCSPIEDQGDLGSCTAHALSGATEFLENQEGEKPFTTLSRLFIYYNERALEGTISQDAGASLRDGVKTLATNGVCVESLWPYNIAKFKSKPPAAAYTDAANRCISVYTRLNTVADMQACLASGFPFVYGFSVYSDFESDRVARTGTVNMPKKSESLLGGHAVLAVGYDNSKSRFLCRNSWGPAWGMAGYFTIPYAYLADRNLSDDFWTIRK